MMENKTLQESHLLIFGLGYAATSITKHISDSVHSITTTNRVIPDTRLADCQHLVFDGDVVSENLADAISRSTHVLISIGPNDAGDPVLNAASNLLKKAKHLRWIGYLSTVGVYGNHDGAWVDENTKCRPVSKRSIERLSAENNWLELANKKDVPLSIFRLSGIYGPGRNALLNIEKGRSRRLVKKDQVFNRIHREDIAQAVGNAIKSGANGIFNITDDEPAPPQDVVTYVHQLRGSEPPPEIDFETADLTPMARSFYGENKRVSNAKSKSELNMNYRWPNYRLAFNAMWRNDSWR